MPISPSENVGTTLGGVVGAVIVVSALTLIIITALVLLYRRTKG